MADSSQNDLMTKAQQYGISPDVAGFLTSDELSALVAGGGLIESKQNNGQIIPVTAQDINNLFLEALHDPSIVEPAKEMLIAGSKIFTESISNLNTKALLTKTTQDLQMVKDREALEKAIQEKGQAYSGYATKARQDLGKVEEGVIRSSIAENTQNVQNLINEFSGKYGTANLPPVAAYQSGAIVPPVISDKNSTLGSGVQSQVASRFSEKLSNTLSITGNKGASAQ